MLLSVGLAAGVKPAQAADKNSGSLNISYMVLAAGNQVQLKNPGKGTVLSWTSSRPGRASVSASGVVRGIAKGRTVITARLKNKNLVCEILVRPKAKINAAKKGGGKWVTDHGETYYIVSGGAMLTGCCPVGDAYYVFDENGRLYRPSKKSLISIGQKTYVVSPDGRAQTGWQVVGKNLYYVNRWGQVLKNKTVQKIEMGKNGAAKDSREAAWQKVVTAVVNSLCTEDMSKSRKLKVCWDYLVDKSNFSYQIRPIVEGSADWQKITGYLMLTTHRGDCYNFAGAFAAMANCIGYKSYMVYGRVSGTRDHAADGLTRHAWVLIGGKHYDPEGQWAGWYRGCYGSSTYRIRHQIIGTYLYRS